MSGSNNYNMDTIEHNQTQTLIMIPQVKWDMIVSDLDEIKDLIRHKALEEVNSRWIESSEARKMLGISQSTWQTYRATGAIPFCQFGKKIYVRHSDIEAFLESHIIRK